MILKHALYAATAASIIASGTAFADNLVVATVNNGDMIRMQGLTDDFTKKTGHTVEQVKAAGAYEIGGQHYKRTPRGYDPHHPNSQYLLYNGLYTSFEGPIPYEFYSAGLVDYCAAHWAAMHPIHAWTVEVAQRVDWGQPAKD